MIEESPFQKPRTDSPPFNRHEKQNMPRSQDSKFQLNVLYMYPANSR